MFHLVALEQVFEHAKGELITDAKKVAAYLESEVAHLFVKVAAPDPKAQRDTE